ncbi:MAG: Gfo/Idh/MocA family oxidoreductase [Opitutaceae bacterium]|nr:Gfo/Idh/MocA family oxidoreductase [Opitutaceae bacterium]
MLIAPKSTRRSFLRNTAALVSSAIFFPRVLPAATLGRDGAVSPNSRLRIASIGLGGTPGKTGKGGRNLDEFLAFPGVECAAICDVKKAARELALRNANAAMRKRLKSAAPQLGPDALFSDLREMLSKLDGKIDAVCVSTPDHWHVPATLACIRRGLPVYCEKPLCRTLSEGRLLADTSAALNAKVLVGSQQRTVYPPILRSVRAVQAGRIGELKRVRVILHKGNPGVPFKPVPVPDGIDYNLWLGPAPVKPYAELRVGGTFRQISDYSEGSISDWGAHHLDIVQMTLGTDLSGPEEVEGSGAFPSSGLYDVPYRYDARLWYPRQKVEVIVTTDPKDCPEVTDTSKLVNGIRFEGTRGSIFCDRSKAVPSNPSIFAGDIPSRNADRDAHKANFLAMITRNAPPAASAEVGHRSATLCHLVYAAARLNTAFKWNPVTERAEGPNADLVNRSFELPRRSHFYNL